MEQLSKTMIEVLGKMKEHGKLIRYHGGFWSWEGVEIKTTSFRKMKNYEYPAWNCDVRTLKALHKRGLVILNESENICTLA